MDTKHLKELQNDEILRKRLAKFMTHFCFRNSKLEKFHDRISQDEMKEITISMADNSLLFLSILFGTEKSDEIIDLLKEKDRVPDWEDPKISDAALKSAVILEDLLKKYKD